MIYFATIIILWIISVCLHEYAHARVALAGGDTSVIDKGYLSLNPLRYLHPMTSIILPVVILILGGLPLPGGAVYIDTTRIRSRAYLSLVSAAGPAANLALLILAALPFALGLMDSPEIASSQLVPILAFFAYLMGLAMILNLLPLPGLDGFGIIEPYLPLEAQRLAREFGRYSLFLLLAIFFTDNPVKSFLRRFPLEASAKLGIAPEVTIEAIRKFFEVNPLR